MGKMKAKDAKLRLYDGTATPYYLEVDLDLGDFSGPLGTPRQDEELVLNRGKMDSEGHYVKGNDYKLLEPVPVSFSVLVRDDVQFLYIKQWLRAGQDGGTTTVNSNTLTTTKEDTQRDGSNNNPAFADTNKLAFNVEYLRDGANDYGEKFAEVFFPLENQNFSEAEDAITLQLNGLVYGTITDITAFTTGTSVEA